MLGGGTFCQHFANPALALPPPQNLFVRTKFMCVNVKQQHFLRRKKPPLLSCTYPDLTATFSPERDMNKIIRDKPSKRFNHS